MFAFPAVYFGLGLYMPKTRPYLYWANGILDSILHYLNCLFAVVLILAFTKVEIPDAATLPLSLCFTWFQSFSPSPSFWVNRSRTAMMTRLSCGTWTKMSGRGVRKSSANERERWPERRDVDCVAPMVAVPGWSFLQFGTAGSQFPACCLPLRGRLRSR
jgi:hypothetical protein